MDLTHGSIGSTVRESDLKDISLSIDGLSQSPTREEFYTNFPFFKYWKSSYNDRLNADEGINIYIHIPFCIQICDFCFYMKELVESKTQVDDYIDTICKEMKMVSEQFGLHKRKVNSIYIGGGTPSVLTEAQFMKLVDAIHKYHQVDHPEFTFEAEPGTFAKSKLDWYKNGGINRISMGVQSFDDEIIKMSSRKHTVKQAIGSIQMLQESGGFKINIDLLSGLAGERMDTWEKSVDTALTNQVDMVTLYKMKAYANTNFFKSSMADKSFNLPSAEQEVEFMKRALEKLNDAKYHRWTTFAYTRDGHRHSYTENIWRGQDLIAYGVSSFGKIGNVNYQNLNDMKLYAEKVSKNEIPVFRSFDLTMKDKMVKELLLCSSRLSSYRKAEFIKKFGFDYFKFIPEAIQQLVDKGYIINDTEELVLTRQGVLYGDFVGQFIASSVKNQLGKDGIGFVY